MTPLPRYTLGGETKTQRRMRTAKRLLKRILPHLVVIALVIALMCIPA